MAQHPLTPQYLLPFAPGVVLGKEEDLKKALSRRATHLNLQEKQLSTLQGIAACTSLKCVYAYNNKLTSLQHTFTGIENLSLLYLDNNRLTNLDGIEDIGKTLTKLYVSYNALNEIGPEFISCQRLTELYIYHQSFPSPDTTFRFHPLAIQSLARTLTVLDLSANRIRDDDLIFLHPLKKLEDLYLQQNQLTDITIVCDFVSQLPHLTKLDIRENPVTNPSVSGPGGAYKGAIINAAANSMYFAWLDGQPIKARYRRFVAGLVQVVQARQEDDEYREQMAIRLNEMADNSPNGKDNDAPSKKKNVPTNFTLGDRNPPENKEGNGTDDPLHPQHSIFSVTSQRTVMGYGGIAGGASLASLNGRSLYLGGGEEDPIPDGLNRVRDRYGNWSFRFWNPIQGNPLIKQYAKQQQKLLFGPTGHHSSSQPRGPAIPPKKQSIHRQPFTKLDPLQHHRDLLTYQPSVNYGSSAMEGSSSSSSYFTNHVANQLYSENSTTDSFTTSIMFSDYGENAPVGVLKDVESSSSGTDEGSGEGVRDERMVPSGTTVKVTNTLEETVTVMENSETAGVPSASESSSGNDNNGSGNNDSSIAATVPVVPTVDDNDINGPGPDEDDEVRIGSDSRIKEDRTVDGEENSKGNNASGNHSAFLRDLEASDSLGDIAASSARDPIDSTNAEDILAATLVPRSRGTPGHHLVGGLSTVAESTGEITDETVMDGMAISVPVAVPSSSHKSTAKPPRPEQFSKTGNVDTHANAAAMAYAAYKAQLDLQSHAIGGAEGFVSHKPVNGEPWQPVYVPVRTPSDYVRTSRFRDSGYTNFNDRAAAERKVAASLISRAKDITQSGGSVVLNGGVSGGGSGGSSGVPKSTVRSERSTIQPLNSKYVSSKVQLPPLGTVSLAGSLRRGSTESFGSEITVDYGYGGNGKGNKVGGSSNRSRSSNNNNGILQGAVSITGTMNIINTYTIGGALARYALHQEAQYPAITAPVSPITKVSSISRGKATKKAGGKRQTISPSRVLGPLPKGYHTPSPWTKG